MTQRARILAVDDVEINLQLLRYVLEPEGFEVMLATSAEGALAAIAAAKPDLVLADLQMPGTDGLELTRIIKANPETADINVIAVTAAAMERDERVAREAGCEGFIAKPIDTRKLVEAITPFLPVEAI